jgi:hypothetical protein
MNIYLSALITTYCNTTDSCDFYALFVPGEGNRDDGGVDPGRDRFFNGCVVLPPTTGIMAHEKETILQIAVYSLGLVFYYLRVS